MILFVDWYFRNRIVSICASFHSIYIQWTQFEPAAWHLHHFLILRDLLTCIVSLKQGVTLALSFGSFHDLQCSLHFQVGLCGRRVVHPLHSTVSGMKNINQTLNFHLSWWGFPSRFLVIGGECKPDSRFDNVGHNTTLMHLIKAEPVMATSLTARHQ